MYSYASHRTLYLRCPHNMYVTFPSYVVDATWSARFLIDFVFPPLTDLGASHEPVHIEDCQQPSGAVGHRGVRDGVAGVARTVHAENI